MDTGSKLEAFEFMLFKLIDWFKEKNQLSNNDAFNTNNDFSKLKVIKLNFFVAAAGAENQNLLETFNNFHAMPLGHVESDIYNDLAGITRYDISSSSLKIKSDYVNSLESSFPDLSQKIKTNIEAAIDALKKANGNFVSYTAFQLVDLSHKWYSWRLMMDIAKSENKLSRKIPLEIIKQENKFFTLSFAY
jgi:uncharacterized phage-associated protein